MILPDDLSGLIDFEAATLRVQSRESRRLEFKQSFDRSHMALYERTLAAFANTHGGVIVFGVADRPRRIVGTPANTIPDDADITQVLRNDFAPEIAFETRTYQVGGLTVFTVGVKTGVDRPVICRNSRARRVLDANGQNPKEERVIDAGAIYYRYTAQTTPIGYNELRGILDEREERRLKIIMETLKAVERVGYERVGVVDVSTFGDPNKATNLYVSKETAKSMNFIEEGRFVESDEEGSPAYLVVGKVSLGEVVRVPMEDADRNLPGEVAATLRQLADELYGAAVPLPASGVKPLLAEFELLEMPFHEYDGKLRRRYITREGIAELEKHMRAEPLRALRCFGSKGSIKAYEAAHADLVDVDAAELAEVDGVEPEA